MRVAITGATGNVGTSVLAALADAPEVEEIVAIARRPAQLPDPRVRFHVADVSRDDLVTPLQDVDAVIHLAWLIQPSRDEAITRATNVEGTERLLQAVAQAGVQNGRPRLLGRRLLARPEGPPGRRVVADRRHPDLLLLAPQGRVRAAARPLRAASSPACASRGCGRG